MTPRWLKKCLYVLFFVQILYICPAQMVANEYAIGTVKLTLVKGSPFRSNWFFFPSGPGISADYLKPLVNNLDVKGKIWLVDFPDSLIPGATDPGRLVDSWKTSLVGLAQNFANPVFVCHAFSGKLALSESRLKGRLAGLVLLNSSPDGRQSEAVRNYSSTLYDSAVKNYQDSPTPKNLEAIWITTADLYFVNTAEGFNLITMSEYFPRANEASDWASTYHFSWVPDPKRSLILAGAEDYVEPYHVYKRHGEFAPHLKDAVLIQGAGHFPWVEKPDAVKDALENFARKVGDLPEIEKTLSVIQAQ